MTDHQTLNIGSDRKRVCVIALLAATASAFILAGLGCETTEGAGRDIKKLGNNIEDAAQDAKD